MQKHTVVVTLVALLVLSGAVRTADAQASYARGQDVSPTFDGWERNSDGTFTLHFGYFNRNAEENFDVPVGADNNLDPGGDRGQPTHFYPGRKWWVFKTVVPADWAPDRRVVWTLTTRGKTNQAKGWLQPEWEVDQELMAKNAPRDPYLMTIGEVDIDHENRPPSISGSSAQSISQGDPLTLTVTASDDGRPKPLPDSTGHLDQGVRIRWIVYRGAGRVRFEPDIMNRRIYGAPAKLDTKVSFTAAGTYRLRAIASDGQAFSTYDVDITVR